MYFSQNQVFQYLIINLTTHTHNSGSNEELKIETNSWAHIIKNFIYFDPQPF